MEERAGRNLGPAKRRNAMAVIGACGLFLLFSHQNCAPSNMSSIAAQTSQKTEGGSPVSVIDDVKSSQALSFNYKEVEVASSGDQVELQGHCSTAQEGAVLGWKIARLNPDGTVASQVEGGQVNCSGGAFKVQLATAGTIVCGQHYKVSAQLGLGTIGETELSRHCN